MSVKKIYFDYGSGWEDVTAYVRDDVVTTLRMSTDTYHYAQNVATFTVIPAEYTALYTALSTIENIKVKIVEDSTQRFQGAIKTRPSVTYTGILLNLEVPVEVTDSIRLLDAEMDTEEDPDEFTLANCYIMNAADKAHSLVHQLAYVAGMTDAQIDDSVVISTVLEGFSGNFSTTSILSCLDTLLYEHGYVIHMDEFDRISPIKRWDSAAVAAVEFDESNSLVEVVIDVAEKNYEGVRVIYNELATKQNVLLYRDELPMDSDGTFTGYWVPSGYFYPIEVNVIDDDTGLRQVVYQEYTETGIQSLTNKAIVENLDFDPRTAMKAFKSDYSSIVLTSGWELEASASGLTVVTSGFYNRKAEIVWQNQDIVASGHYIYYANIYGTVLYKGKDKKVLITTVSGTKKIEEYRSNYVYTDDIATSLAQSIVAEQVSGNVAYQVRSELDLALGTFVNVNLGTVANQLCIILEKVGDEQTPGIYQYMCKAYAVDVAPVLGRFSAKQAYEPIVQTVVFGLDKYALSILADYDGSNPVLTNASISARVFIDGMEDTTNWGFTVSVSGVVGSLLVNTYTISGMSEDHGTVSFEISKIGYATKTLLCDVSRLRQGVIEYVQTTVPSYTPRYRGPVLDGTPAGINVTGDVYLLYSEIQNTVTPPTTEDPPDHRGVFKYTGTAWEWTTEPADMYMAIRDIVDICTILTVSGTGPLYGVVADYGVTTSIDSAHIRLALIDYLKGGSASFAGDVDMQNGTVRGILDTPVLSTTEPQTGDVINVPAYTHWLGSAFTNHCAGLANGEHLVDATSTFDGKNVTKIFKGGASYSPYYQRDDAIERSDLNVMTTIKTLVSTVEGPVSVFYSHKPDEGCYSASRVLVNGVSYGGDGTDDFSIYTQVNLHISIEIGDVLELQLRRDWDKGEVYCSNFRICPEVSTIGVYNDTDSTVKVIPSTAYFTQSGNINVASLDDFVTEYTHWNGLTYINLFDGLVRPSLEQTVASGVFNSKNVESVYITGDASIRFTFDDATTLLLSAASYYTYPQTDYVALLTDPGEIEMFDHFTFNPENYGSDILFKLYNLATLLFQIYPEGRMLLTAGRAPSGAVHTSSISHTTLFNTIAPHIPATGDVLVLHGYCNGYVVSRASRTAAGTVGFNGYRLSDGVVSSFTITSGISTTFAASMTW